VNDPLNIGIFPSHFDNFIYDQVPCVPSQLCVAPTNDTSPKHLLHRVINDAMAKSDPKVPMAWMLMLLELMSKPVYAEGTHVCAGLNEVCV